MAVVNSTIDTQDNLGQETGQTESGLVAFYDIRPGLWSGSSLSTLEPARGKANYYLSQFKKDTGEHSVST